MVEIYNETIQDLLSSDCSILEIRTQGNKIHLPGLCEMFVESQDDIDDIVRVGQKNRRVAATKMNSQRYVDIWSCMLLIYSQIPQDNPRK